MPAHIVRRLLVSVSLGLSATALTATAVLAAPPPPDPGDSRATAHAGNATTCAEAGLPGTTVTLPSTEDPTHTFLTISNSDIPAGDTLLAVVVKGGPAYNVYQGLSEWTLLHSPLDPGGNIPTISHWFACVTKANNGGGGPTTTYPTTAPPTSTSVMPRTTAPGESSSTSAPATTTTTAPGATTTVVGASPTSTSTTGSGSLPSTGFGNSWLIWVGVLLLLVGGGIYALPRLARRRS